MKLILIVVTFLIHQAAFCSDKVLYNGLGQSQQHKLIAMTIAGIVNRTEPRLYLLNVYETWSYNLTDEKWRDLYQEDGNFQFRTIININDLIDYFKKEIKGSITYDPSLTYSNFSGQSFMWQGEFAAMLGGLTDCIPVPFDNTFIQISKQENATIKDYNHILPDLKISARLEDKSHSWNNNVMSQETRYLTIIKWGLDNILSRTNPGGFYLREITDWAVTKRMFQVNLAGTESLRFSSLSDEKAEILERIMTHCRSKRPGKLFNVYGWMRPESLTQWISAWGGSFHETLLSNLSWHHIYPVDKNFIYSRKSQIKESDINLENKVYVLFIGSEGDAGNWNFGFQSGAWLSTARGKVPVGWGFNLHFFEQFPFIAQYYYKTASPNDGFMAVTSPLGYAYHDMFPEEVIADAKNTAKNLLSKYAVPGVYAYKHYNGAGVSKYRGITISNNYDFNKLGQFASEINADLTFLFDPKLQTQKLFQNFGGLLFNHVDDQTFYANTTNLSEVTNRIIQKIKTFKQGPAFLLAGYQRLRSDDTPVNGNNPADLTLPQLQNIMNSISSDSETGKNTEFVTPEKFIALIKKSLNTTSEVVYNDVIEIPKIYIVSTDQIKIVFSNSGNEFRKLTIFDLNGKKLAHRYTDQNELEFEMQHGQNNHYILQVIGKAGVTNYRFVH